MLAGFTSGIGVNRVSIERDAKRGRGEGGKRLPVNVCGNVA